jgi:tetratricopeptide (TPR) repeat protein
MAKNISTDREKRLENEQEQKAAQLAQSEAETEEYTTIDGDAIAAATAHLFKGLMSQIQYAAQAVANGEDPRMMEPEGSPMRPKEVIDVRNLSKEIPVWIQRAYNSNDDATEELTTNPELLEWIDRKSCKRKEYYEDFKALQQLTDFYAELGRFELGIKAAEKALAITNLHRQGDPEVFSDLNWSLAQLNAANGEMEKAERWLTKCILIVEPGADSDSETYQGLMAQLNETYNNAHHHRERRAS